MRSADCGVIRAKALSYVTQPFRAEIRIPKSAFKITWNLASGQISLDNSFKSFNVMENIIYLIVGSVPRRLHDAV
jgi:hypothetical protein